MPRMKIVPARLGEAVKSPSFIEKSLLLLATAALTGILVPEISSRMAHDRTKEQLNLEAGLARQDKIIEAQSALYDRVADLVWEFHLLNVNVSFRRFLDDPAKYAEAVDRYAKESAGLLGRIRAEISKSRRLAGPAGYGLLLQLYEKELLPRDAILEALIAQKEPDRPAWQTHHQAMLSTVLTAIDSTLEKLAAEMTLTAPGAGKP